MNIKKINSSFSIRIDNYLLNVVTTLYKGAVMKNEVFNVFPEIITESLKLREIKQEYSQSIYKLLSNPDVIKYDTFDILLTSTGNL